MSDAAADASALATQLESADTQSRLRAAESLSRMAEAAAPAAVSLVRACGDTADELREFAVAALEDLGPPPPETIGQLITLVDHAGPLVAYWAATLLGRAGESAASAVPALAKCVDSTAELSVRQRAAWALGKIGPAAGGGREALTRAARHDDPRLARLAAEALEAIDA